MSKSRPTTAALVDRAMKNDYNADFVDRTFYCPLKKGASHELRVYESDSRRLVVEILPTGEWNVYSHHYYSGPKRGTS